MDIGPRPWVPSPEFRLLIRTLRTVNRFSVPDLHKVDLHTGPWKRARRHLVFVESEPKSIILPPSLSPSPSSPSSDSFRQSFRIPRQCFSLTKFVTLRSGPDRDSLSRLRVGCTRRPHAAKLPTLTHTCICFFFTGAPLATGCELGFIFFDYVGLGLARAHGVGYAQWQSETPGPLPMTTFVELSGWFAFGSSLSLASKYKSRR
jgi:hypothetical protein